MRFKLEWEVDTMAVIQIGTILRTGFMGLNLSVQSQRDALPASFSSARSLSTQTGLLPRRQMWWHLQRK